jgi:hypothetical protein
MVIEPWTHWHVSEAPSNKGHTYSLSLQMGGSHAMHGLLKRELLQLIELAGHVFLQVLLARLDDLHTRTIPVKSSAMALPAVR